MRILKYHPHRSVLFVTFSMEEGLLLSANPLCQAIIRSCLARAQTLFPVIISHFIVQANHLHMILVVKNPDDVKDFVRHLKTESAHLLNGILGRNKRTIWCEGYDSPVVLTPLRALTAIAYLYANPSKDDLEESIDRFPGVSSWKMFIRKENTKVWQWIRRPAVKALPSTAHNLRGYTAEAQRLLAGASSSHEFTIQPNAWMEAFGITDPKTQEQTNARLIERVRTLEKRAARQRKFANRHVIGREVLISRPIDIIYRPERTGKRMCCLSEDRSERIRFINFLKDLYAKAREVAERWKLGDYSQPFPLGLYPPSLPKLAEPLAGW